MEPTPGLRQALNLNVVRSFDSGDRYAKLLILDNFKKNPISPANCRIRLSACQHYRLTTVIWREILDNFLLLIIIVFIYLAPQALLNKK